MAQDPKKQQNSDKLCVLIIEEKTDLRTFFMTTLTKTEKFEVVNAANAQEALDILNKDAKKIHFILFDWNMKDMPGYVFSQKIKDTPDFEHIELIVCSAAFSTEDTFLMSEIDIYYTMPKVVNAAELISKMEDARLSYKNNNSLTTKLKQLQHIINDSDLKSCDQLLAHPEIEKEIMENNKYAYLGGEIRILHKKYSDAISYLKNRLEKNHENKQNENLKTFSTLGRALCLIGNFEEALTIYERLEAKSPHNLSHKIMLGDALLGMENVAGAEEKYNDVLKQDATNNKALAGMVKSSSVSGNFDQAASFFEKMDGHFESKALASFFNNRGVALVKKGEVEDAILFYENALQFFDKYKSQVYFNLGMAYYRSGNIASALSCFQAAMAQDANLVNEKKILKELQDKGAEKFMADHSGEGDKKKK
ncbi:response regulator [Silvanigrella aquatica]|uniref:Response regulatory domain-containing protein n=1 Tax=Silvanigrella aquatica TaxID=1915309 RepID=A0A1L4D0Z1_9BACT|nr:response regulator [Silvanigrella aquatica]APJ03869.1 hypothetical protein AXG55_08095 [Silvanigrella aquatica]